MLVKRIAECTHLSSTVYELQRCLMTMRYINLYYITLHWSEIATFSYPLAFNAPVGGGSHWNSRKSSILRKLESWGNQAVKTLWR